MSAGASGSVSAGSEVTAIAGFVTPQRCSSCREALSRRVMTSTFSLRMRQMRWVSRSSAIGPMPQPYIITRLPHFFACEIV